MHNTHAKRTWCIAIVIILCIAMSFFGGWFTAGKLNPGNTHTEQQITLHSQNPQLEHLVGSAVYQLSAEADALMKPFANGKFDLKVNLAEFGLKLG